MKVALVHEIQKLYLFQLPHHFLTPDSLSRPDGKKNTSPERAPKEAE